MPPTFIPNMIECSLEVLESVVQVMLGLRVVLEHQYITDLFRCAAPCPLKVPSTLPSGSFRTTLSKILLGQLIVLKFQQTSSEGLYLLI